MVRLLIHLRVTPDRKMVEAWLGEHIGNLAAWVSFWPFFIVMVEKCLGPRGAQATSRAVQALYDEIVDEVIIIISTLSLDLQSVAINNVNKTLFNWLCLQDTCSQSNLQYLVCF